MVGEFDLIETYFKPLAGTGALGLLDDAALIKPDPSRDLVITKDLMIEGVHFFPDADPFDLAWKLLSVNISDLVAKGASPTGYFLGISLPKPIDPAFCARFAAGLDAAQKAYDCVLLGGDTTGSLGPISLSLTAVGQVPKDKMVLRSTAAVGDYVYVSGPLGNAALALHAIQSGQSGQGASKGANQLDAALLRPTARIDLLGLIARFASASADVSDGLIADLGHILKASGNLGADVQEKLLPVSDQALDYIANDKSLEALVYSGGEDYQLVFTVRPDLVDAMDRYINDHKLTAVTRIGMITKQEKLRLLDSNGSEIDVQSAGYRHF